MNEIIYLSKNMCVLEALINSAVNNNIIALDGSM